MDKAFRDQLFARAGTRDTPLLFIDDEFVGTFEELEKKHEQGTFDQLFNY